MGTACLKKGQSIWAFNFVADEGLYYLVTPNAHDAKPIITKSGVWSWTDRITGEVTVNFVLADGQCADWIKGQDPNADKGDRIVLNDINRNNCKMVAYQTVTVATTQN